MPEQTTQPTTQTEGSQSTETPAAGTPPAEGTPATPAAESKPATPPEGETPADPAKPAEPTTQDVVPESYEFKAPEGMTYDVAVITPFSEAAKAAGLSQEKAAGIVEKMAPAIKAAQEAQVARLQQEWQTASKADTELGGEKFTENVGTAQKAIAMFAPKDGETPSAFAKLLEDTGLGNHPEMIRFLYRVGKSISPDGAFVAGQSVTTPKSLASIMYDHSTSSSGAK